MGLGGARVRLTTVGVLIASVAALLSLSGPAHAERSPERAPNPPTYLPVACARPLGAEFLNPACSIPRPVAAIYGLAYIDTNGNGEHEPEEDTVEGYQVHLQHADWSEPLTAQPIGGYYCFEGLEPGDYTMTVTLSPEDAPVLEPLDEGTGDIALHPAEAISHDLRYARWYQPPPPPQPGFTLHLPLISR